VGRVLLGGSVLAMDIERLNEEPGAPAIGKNEPKYCWRGMWNANVSMLRSAIVGTKDKSGADIVSKSCVVPLLGIGLEFM